MLFRSFRGATGIWWDHSTKKNDEGFKLPRGYEDDVVKKDEKQWKGVYIESLMMGMPDDFECTSEDVEKEKDRMGNRISLGLKKVIIDGTGFSGAIAIEDVFAVQTYKAGGWAFTLDEISVDIVQNNFNEFAMGGRVRAPLFEGDLKYKGSIKLLKQNGNETLGYEFSAKPGEKGMKFPLFIADLTLDESCLKLSKEGSDSLKVEFIANGKMNIGTEGFKKGNVEKGKGIEINIFGVEFNDIRVANFPYPKLAKAEAENKKSNPEYTAAADTSIVQEYHWGPVYFYPGKIKVASEQKKAEGFNLSLNDKVITLANDYRDDNMQPVDGVIGVRFGGEIGIMDNLVYGGVVVTIYNKVDMNSLTSAK